MSADPWTDPDPQPGDFDAELAKLDPRHIERHEGDPEARLIVLVGVEGEDAKRLERLADARGKNAAAVVSELLREAERSAA
jgi:pyruvate/2-oxoacid:ferredoxin oxidoreductase alpha subunit